MKRFSVKSIVRNIRAPIWVPFIVDRVQDGKVRLYKSSIHDLNKSPYRIGYMIYKKEGMNPIRVQCIFPDNSTADVYVSEVGEFLRLTKLVNGAV